MAFGIDDILANITGVGKTLVDRLVPDRNKKQDQDHETAMKQADITEEGEKAKNYFTPRSVLMYALTFVVIYGMVIQPFLVAFGVKIPFIDYTPQLKFLAAMLGFGG